MKNIVKRWVHLSYSRDLQTIGIQPVQFGNGPYDAFLLSTDEWAAFRAMYGDAAPTLYDHQPGEGRL